MASELTLSLALNFSKGNAQITKALSAVLDVAGNKYAAGNPTVATSDTVLSKGGVGTIGYVYLKNTDATNFALFGGDGTNYPIKLKPGESLITRWNGTNVHAKADTASVSVEYIIVED